MNPHTYSMAWLRYVALPTLLILTVACVGIATANRSNDVTAANAPRVCFPAKSWAGGTVPYSKAPCVRVSGVYEDGSFTYTVTDKSSRVRYMGSAGALDR